MKIFVAMWQLFSVGRIGVLLRLTLRVRSVKTVKRDRAYAFRPYPKRLECLTPFADGTQRQHILLSYFKTLSVGPVVNRTRAYRSKV